MSSPININLNGEKLELQARVYRIYLLGGFGIDLGDFSITLMNIESSVITRCEKAFWPVQVYASGKRGKRILIVDIKESGIYEIFFNHPETLKVKHSNLKFFSLFSRHIPNESLEVLITEKYGAFGLL